MTWALAAIMVVLSILSVAFLSNTQSSGSAVMDQAVEQQTTSPNNIPGIPQGETSETPAPAGPVAPAQ